MSQSVITRAFVEWKARQAVDNLPVLLDEFVFALVPDLDITNPIPDTEPLPPEEQIMHRQPVAKAGVVNLNAVVYSVTMGASTGDFDFNWIGLINRQSGTVAAITHAPTQSKIKTSGGQQGNVLTRSILMEFNNAQQETAITVPAETWQIDFTARMAGMDERQRLENIDIYGPAAFFGDSFKVEKKLSVYEINAGVAYVGGLRAHLDVNKYTNTTRRPVKIWVDVTWQGSLVSVWNARTEIVVADTLEDYETAGQKHYVFAVAEIDANGAVIDLRPLGTLAEQQASQLYLHRKNNLSDLESIAEAHENLELGEAARLDLGDEAGTVAEGNDPRIVYALDKRSGGEVQEPVLIKNVLSLGSWGTGVFNGEKPGVNIGDSDSGFLNGGDGRIDLYSNDSLIGWFDAAGFRVNYLEVTGGYLRLRGNDRKHIQFMDADGRTRMFIYKDRGGDGIHFNNGDDGGGDFIMHRNGEFYSPGALHAGAASIQADGNAHGPVWGGYLSEWIWARVNTAQNNAINWAYGSCVQDIRLGSSSEFNERSNNERMGGGVMTSFSDRGSSNYWIRLRPLQKSVGGNWYTVAYQ